MGKITKIEQLSPDALVPYERNAKQHPQDQIEKIAASIQEFGFLSPCLVDKDNNIIAGHGRVEAAKALSLKTIPCVRVEGLTEAQRRAYILADNRLTELGGWDMETVSAELEELKEGGFDIGLTGFSVDDIIITDDMSSDITEEEAQGLTEEEPFVKRGEIWKLGNHRLMCGDSTDKADVATLMGGTLADLLLTDPPYGVDYGNVRDLSEAIARRKLTDGLIIANDNMSDEELRAFLCKAFQNGNDSMREGAAFYIWHATTKALDFIGACKDIGWEMRECLIWVKNTFAMGRQDYQWKHEPCIYGWKEGAAHYFIDVRSLTTVFDKNLNELTKEELIELIKEERSATTTIYCDKPSKSEIHPTMKPVPLFEKLIRNSTQEGETVLDLFGGSGTTLIACEEMNRRCLMMEYDPKYASAIVRRWEQLTGKKAEKLN